MCQTEAVSKLPYPQVDERPAIGTISLGTQLHAPVDTPMTSPAHNRHNRLRRNGLLFHPRFQRFESTTGFFLQQVRMHPFHPVGDEKPQDFGSRASFALGRLFKGNFKLSANSCLNQLVKHVIT